MARNRRFRCLRCGLSCFCDICKADNMRGLMALGVKSLWSFLIVSQNQSALCC
jgi:hypothetical protein